MQEDVGSEGGRGISVACRKSQKTFPHFLGESARKGGGWVTTDAACQRVGYRLHTSLVTRQMAWEGRKRQEKSRLKQVRVLNQRARRVALSTIL